MKFEGQSKRVRERLELALPVRVHGRDNEEVEWVERSRLLDVTPFGARFTLPRPTEPGRLLHLTLPMPRQLRCFDHVEDQYRVWALVRNIKMVPAADEKGVARFEVGVAFIGKRPPASYESNPTQRYDVAASATDSGLWGIQEMEQQDRAALAEKPRPETRHSMAIDVIVEVFDEKGHVSQKETTVTENISRRGAAVFTTLDAESGRFVRLTSAQYNISVVAAIRARRKGADGIMRLHLEFIDRQWPLEGIG
jgi:hypothetical protein